MITPEMRRAADTSSEATRKGDVGFVVFGAGFLVLFFSTAISPWLVPLGIAICCYGLGRCCRHYWLAGRFHKEWERRVREAEQHLAVCADKREGEGR